MISEKVLVLHRFIPGWWVALQGVCSGLLPGVSKVRVLLQDTQSKYKMVIWGSKGEQGKEEERLGQSFLLGTSILAVPLLFTSCFKKKKKKFRCSSHLLHIQGQRAPSLGTPLIQRKHKFFKPRKPSFSTHG